MEELYYYIPTNQGTNTTQHISHIQRQQQVPPQLVAYYPSTNYIIPQRELLEQQQRQRNSQSHPQLYPYPQPQVMYTNQLANPRYTTVYVQVLTQQGPNTSIPVTNTSSTNLYQELPHQLNTTASSVPNGQNTVPVHFNNDANASPTSVTHQNLPNVKLPPLSSLVSQIKSTTQSCPDISILASQSTSPTSTMNVNNIRGFTSAATSISSASSSNKNNCNNNSANNHRNSIPYILTFATKHEDNNLHTVTNHNQSIQLPISNFPIRETTSPIYTTSPKQNNQKINKMVVTNRNSNENLTNLIKRNDITIIEPIRINHTNVNDMKINTLNKGSNGKVPSQQRKQCPICGKICSRPSTLKTHFLIHTGDNPFKCSWVGCKKSFNVKSNMLRHLKSHQRKLEKLAKKQADLLNKEKLKQSNDNNCKSIKKK